jgi:hypothetical protein
MSDRCRLLDGSACVEEFFRSWGYEPSIYRLEEFMQQAPDGTVALVQDEGARLDAYFFRKSGTEVVCTLGKLVFQPTTS